ncbi:MAG: phosphoglucomutase/phosphomannomutase family protein [Heliobacteriaceae bacterium]|nr:phosphoglucomutase/phosphomannomutase family protein [Heliobacteriaceae bacterium]MDD4588293.1 phosphoglucomutase/phosphomannomutase family protein [Heliobacteriaceae bacterium]
MIILGIKFGTDGWRAVMAEDFTFGNVAIVAQAIADYVKETGLASRGIIIGYDNRFFSDRFAQRVAEVLTGNEILVLLPRSAMPTPVTAFAIRQYQTAGAVMVTASHNPAEYNGIKFIPEYAGPALPAVTDQIERQVNVLVRTGERQLPRLSLAMAKERRLVREINPFSAYLDHLSTLIDLPVIGGADLQVVVDPLWGAGIGYLEAFWQRCGVKFRVIHGHRDPLFGGSLPEPVAAVLKELRQQVTDSGAHLGLALDGDADRFGIIDADGTYISPNQVLTLLFHHFLTRRGQTGMVARTVATTHMLDRIAAKHGLTVTETPVGFKYIGQALLQPDCLLGGEESGGLSVRGHLPEKDGILACALVAEVRAAAGCSLQEALAAIGREYGRLVSHRLDLRTAPAAKSRVLAALEQFHPPALAGVAVVNRLTVDGVKLVLADGAYALVRASGTEPLFRLYVEANDEAQLHQIQTEVKAAIRL